MEAEAAAEGAAFSPHGAYDLPGPEEVVGVATGEPLCVRVSGRVGADDATDTCLEISSLFNFKSMFLALATSARLARLPGWWCKELEPGCSAKRMATTEQELFIIPPMRENDFKHCPPF